MAHKVHQKLAPKSHFTGPVNPASTTAEIPLPIVQPIGPSTVCAKINAGINDRNGTKSLKSLLEYAYARTVPDKPRQPCQKRWDNLSLVTNFLEL